MSRFDIMRAVVEGTMKAPELPPELTKPRRVTLEGKPIVRALSSIKLRRLKTTERTDWLGRFELNTGQV